MKSESVSTFTELDVLTDLESAYIAGLFDGEGCIHMTATKYWSKKKKEITIHHYPQIIIRMTAGNWESIARKTGLGRFYYRNSKNRLITEWKVCRPKEIINLLKTLLPYLRVKYCEAIDMISALTTKPKNSYINSKKR